MLLWAQRCPYYSDLVHLCLFQNFQDRLHLKVYNLWVFCFLFQFHNKQTNSFSCSFKPPSFRLLSIPSLGYLTWIILSYPTMTILNILIFFTFTYALYVRVCLCMLWHMCVNQRTVQYEDYRTCWHPVGRRENSGKGWKTASFNSFPLIISMLPSLLRGEGDRKSRLECPVQWGFIFFFK